MKKEQEEKYSVNNWILKRVVILAILLLSYWIASPYLTDVKDSTRILIASGYKPISVGGYGWFQEGLFSTKFKAITMHGDTVSGAVTRGLLKKNTIRLD